MRGAYAIPVTSRVLAWVGSPGIVRSMSARHSPKPEVRPYDLFIMAVTILSIINLILYMLINNTSLLYAIAMIDFLLSGLFFVDFLRLFTAAPSKRQYFFREFGWADLLASTPFPQFKILRIFRLVKAYGIVRRAGGRAVMHQLLRERASAAVLIVLFTIILLLEFGSVGILAIEGNNPEANITSASDALWWVYVTITTVGYGDAYPVTNAGRLLGVFVMLVGVGLFGVVTGFLANKFLPQSRESEETTMLNKDAAIAQIQDELREIRNLIESNKK